MIENKKIYNIKIYNDELDTIVTVLLERIKQLTLKLSEEIDDIQKTFIRADIQNYHTIITRLNTGVIYNDEKYIVDNLDKNI